jgi:uncharacterized protein YbaP (TraB family)
MPTIVRQGPRAWLRDLCRLGLALGLLAGCATGGKPAPPPASTRTPPPAPAVAPAPAPAPVAWGRDGDLAVGPPLWQVEGRNGTPLFLFGTMHTELTASVPPEVWERLRASRTLAFEADVAALGVQAVMAKALLPPGESLDTLLGAEAWARLRDYLKSTVPEAALVRLRPWFVVTLVVLKASGLKPGDDPMDLGLMKAGRDAGKTLLFLETADEQIDLLARTFDARVVAALATNLDAVPELLQQMTTAYRTGDLRGIEAILADKEYRLGLGEDAARLLLGARNERWLPFVEKLVAEGGGFVAVGVGHLPGTDGLVALLRARGYQVTRVPAAH